MVETTENCCFSNAETPSAMRQKRLFREKAGNQIAGGSKTKLHSGLKLRAVCKVDSFENPHQGFTEMRNRESTEL